MAIGEKPPHRIVEVTDQIVELLTKKIIENPGLKKTSTSSKTEK